MPGKLNWINRKSWRWTVIGYTPNDPRVECICDCGTKRKVLKSSFCKASSKSCGCHKREMTIKRSIKHGQATRVNKTAEYCAWSEMMRRCYNEKNKKYADYGGRGILVCPEWHSSSVFLSQCGIRPSNKHSWGRIDNNKGYEPGNCRWEDRHQQANNVRNNVNLTLGPVTLTAAQWARERPMISAETLRVRKKKGWSDEDCLLKPIKRTKL